MEAFENILWNCWLIYRKLEVLLQCCFKFWPSPLCYSHTARDSSECYFLGREFSSGFRRFVFSLLTCALWPFQQKQQWFFHSILRNVKSLYISHTVSLFFMKQSLRFGLFLGRSAVLKILLLKFSFSEKATKICAIVHMVLTFIKVWTFWEAHKIWKNLHRDLYIYLINIQTRRKIFSNFVCFSESLNFK